MKRHVSMLREEISHHLTALQDFEKYHRFINNPFVLSIHDLPSEDKLIQEQFIDLINDGDTMHIFREVPFSDIWIRMAYSNPDVAKLVLKGLISFATTYERERLFSTIIAIKTKSRNRLEVPVP